jgi:hypothetical protein
MAYTDMKHLFRPDIIVTAFFLALIITDISQGKTNLLAAHAITGVIWILIVSLLCHYKHYAFAWLLVAAPWLIILGSIWARDYRNQVAASKTMKPQAPQKNSYEPARYFI